MVVVISRIQVKDATQRTILICTKDRTRYNPKSIGNSDSSLSDRTGIEGDKSKRREKASFAITFGGLLNYCNEFDIPDSAENARVFGYPGSRPGTKASFPKARLVILVEAGTHLIIDAQSMSL